MHYIYIVVDEETKEEVKKFEDYQEARDFVMEENIKQGINYPKYGIVFRRTYEGII